MPLLIYADTDIPSQSEILEQMTAGRPMHEAVGGYVHTPTTKANFNAPSMQKWGSCRNYVRAFGDQKPTAAQFEFLMGYPPEWTNLDE